MTRFPLILIALGLLIWFSLTARRMWQEARARKATRAAWMADVADQLSDPRQTLTETGFPRLSGQFQGHSFDLQAIPDALSYRKLPTLWLMVTLTEPMPLKAETRIMARASGLEAFSTFASLPVEVTLPPDFPPHCTLRTQDAAALPPVPVLAPIARLMADPKVKEVVLSPKGLRIVYLAEEGARSAYLIHRDAEFGQSRLSLSLARHLMETTLSLAEDLNAR